MEIEFTRSAFKDFKKLPSNLQKRVINVLERIRISPWRYVRKLRGYKNLYRVRVGDYRIILKINKKMFVIKIAHRKQVYSYI